VFHFRSVVFACVSSALIVATSAVPSLAYQPVPTDHLVGDFNPKAMDQAGQNWSDVGDLQATRYMTVTPSGMTGPTTVTFRGAGPNGVKREVRLTNGVTTHIDFGQVQNADGTGELTAYWYPGISQTHIHLDIHATRS
jgi:hypothetical protein